MQVLSQDGRMETELTAAADIADAGGRLNRAAVGWGRRPDLFRCALDRRLSRVARWSYWHVSCPSGALTLLVVDAGALGAVVVSFLDLDAGRAVERVHVGRPPAMSDDPDGDVEVDARRLRLSLRARGDDVLIAGEARTLLGARLEIDLAVARARESVNVLVPWDDSHFHFTSKQVARAARGVVRTSGRAHRFDGGFACLDFGRARWPPRLVWDWAFAAAGDVGFNLGGRWTDGTGVTENGLVAGGRVHKIADPVTFAGDTIRGGPVDLRFAPLHARTIALPPLVRVHQRVGRFSGGVGTARVEDALGLMETVRYSLAWRGAAFFT
jgi:uncharacterized protein DUF2804